MLIHSNNIIEKKTDPKFQYFKISPFQKLDFTVSFCNVEKFNFFHQRGQIVILPLLNLEVHL